MKKCLPGPTKVSKDAKECVQECTSEFISFITAEAAELCAGEKRKTINGEDILTAMTTLGFENYSDTLKIYLTKYRVVRRRSSLVTVAVALTASVTSAATIDGQAGLKSGKEATARGNGRYRNCPNSPRIDVRGSRIQRIGRGSLSGAVRRFRLGGFRRFRRRVISISGVRKLLSLYSSVLPRMDPTRCAYSRG